MPALRHQICAQGALAALLVAAPAVADEPAVTVESFGATVKGQTFAFHIEENGDLTPFATERYLPDQSVVLMFEDGQCLEGRWYAQDGQICFAYEGDINTCWQLDAETPETGAAFSYRVDDHRQVAFPTRTYVPTTCDTPIS